MKLGDIVEKEFEKFKKKMEYKNFKLESGIVNPSGMVSNASYTIYELDESGEKIHRVAEIEDESYMDYDVTITFRQKWYPEFEEHAIAIQETLKDDSSYNTTIRTNFSSEKVPYSPKLEKKE